MPTFKYEFIVNAPQTVVADFHFGSSVKTLTPPLIIVQLHEFEPLAEGSLADFTLWFGPIPINWKVTHSDVSQNGFTDTQIEGPLLRWRHKHSFIALDEQTTKVSEHIEYAFKPGYSGLLSRLLFAKPALTFLFTARKIITRRHVAKMVANRV